MDSKLVSTSKQGYCAVPYVTLRTAGRVDAFRDQRREIWPSGSASGV
jgi:hypothetical protein